MPQTPPPSPNLQPNHGGELMQIKDLLERTLRQERESPRGMDAHCCTHPDGNTPHHRATAGTQGAQRARGNKGAETRNLGFEGAIESVGVPSFPSFFSHLLPEFLPEKSVGSVSFDAFALGNLEKKNFSNLGGSPPFFEEISQKKGNKFLEKKAKKSTKKFPVPHHFAPEFHTIPTGGKVLPSTFMVIRVGIHSVSNIGWGLWEKVQISDSGMISHETQFLDSGMISHETQFLDSGMISHETQILDSGMISHETQILDSGMISNDYGRSQISEFDSGIMSQDYEQNQIMELDSEMIPGHFDQNQILDLGFVPIFEGHFGKDYENDCDQGGCSNLNDPSDFGDFDPPWLLQI